MEYRIDTEGLFNRFSAWDRFIKRKVHLIACGGTALTLLNLKASTKDVDLIVPEAAEYDYLVSVLKRLGYKATTGAGWARDDGFIFDLFRGKNIHTTELLESPLRAENHILIKEFNHIYLGVLNFYDLIISKLFRGSSVDMDDCLSLVKAKRQEIDLDILKKRFKETASFDISEEKVNKNLKHFLEVIGNEGFYGKK
jgi:hypothetical protein